MSLLSVTPVAIQQQSSLFNYQSVASCAPEGAGSVAFSTESAGSVASSSCGGSSSSCGGSFNAIG